LKQADTPRSYMVETPNGTIRRNSFHLTSAHRQEEDSWPDDEELSRLKINQVQRDNDNRKLHPTQDTGPVH
jgi:hypothetical protein